MVEASVRSDRGQDASGSQKKPGRKPASPTSKARPTLTKLVQRERELAALYRLVLAKVHLPYGRDALDASAMSHELRAARIEKHEAEIAEPGSTKPSATTSMSVDPTTPPLTASTLLQRIADALGPHAAIASLATAERRLLRAYERLDIDSLPPKTRLFVEGELYPEQVRTTDTARAVKESYA